MRNIRVLSTWVLSLGFVSDFVLRISDLAAAKGRVKAYGGEVGEPGGAGGEESITPLTNSSKRAISTSIC